MDQKPGPGCDEPVTDKLEGPLQSSPVQCLTYNEKPKYDYKVMPIIWIMGGPGSGKTTVCKRIVSTYELVYVSVGQVLRDEMAKGSTSASGLMSVMGKGELAPNDLVIPLLKDTIERHAAEGARGFVVRGYPREERQGVEFERVVGQASMIIYLEASEDTFLSRLQAREKAPDRIDESPGTLKLRIETFMKHNPSILELYKDRLVKINAEDPPDKVFSDITTAMDQLISRPIPKPQSQPKPRVEPLREEYSMPILPKNPKNYK